MIVLRYKRNKEPGLAANRYNVIDSKCIGRSCLHLGQYSQGVFCCMNNAYRGCPDNRDTLYSKEEEAKNKAKGITDK